MFSLEKLFCSVDDFCQAFEPLWQKQLLSHGLQRRNRTRQLCLSEVMTILIGFHQHHYRTFKHYYIEHVCLYWGKAFRALVSYSRFGSWIASALLPLCAYLKHNFGQCTGISYIDSSRLKLCHNRRIQQHQVFSKFAARGKTSVVYLRWGGALWFF